VASEQSVSPEIPYIAKQGFKWICSDEAVLGWTLSHFSTAMELAMSWNQRYYTNLIAWRRQLGIAIVFRDHRLSDLIGFTYGSNNPRAAADLVGSDRALPQTSARRWQHSTRTTGYHDRPDGENCWEFYHQDGKPFLENLYQTLSDHSQLKL